MDTKTKKVPPAFGGGQGRSGDDVRTAGEGLSVSVGLSLLALMALALLGVLS